MKRSPTSTVKSKATAQSPAIKQPKPSASKPAKKSAICAPAKSPKPTKTQSSLKVVKAKPGAQANSGSKKNQLITLLGSASGATMAQMTALTGWLPHTLRAMISVTLRKHLGLDVQQQVEDGVRVYRILGVQSQ